MHNRKKILILSNIILPAPAKEIGIKGTNFGGWISEIVTGLVLSQKYSLSVATIGPVQVLRKIVYDDVTYYVAPGAGKGLLNISLKDCNYILKDSSPDLLHAEGTELAFTRTFLELFVGKKILSIQGILKEIKKYYFSGIFSFDSLKLISIKSIIPIFGMVYNYLFRFLPRIRDERKSINLVGNIIGRTEWDKFHALNINKSARYFHCERILRKPFVLNKWNYNQCKKKTIFIGNSSHPYKGVHIAFQAIALLLDKYPEINIIIAGQNAFDYKDKKLSKFVGYHAYLKSLINKLNIIDNITFTGELNAKEMADKMAESHIYLLCSSIENSPNTLAEAMSIGVPTVASFVGGVQSMATNELNCLMYRSDDYVYLAGQIERLLTDEELCCFLSLNSIEHSSKNYSRDNSIDKLMHAYDTVLNNYHSN
jgi:glycosyltransferase involved in cell wall biosynthesis